MLKLEQFLKVVSRLLALLLCLELEASVYIDSLVLALASTAQLDAFLTH